MQPLVRRREGTFIASQFNSLVIEFAIHTTLVSVRLALGRIREEAPAPVLEGTGHEKAMTPWSNFVRGLGVIRSVTEEGVVDDCCCDACTARTRI